MKYILSLCLFYVSSLGICQEDSLSKKQIRKNRPAYIALGIGLNQNTFRDFATSPLYYSGIIPSYSVGYKKSDVKREGLIDLHYTAGSQKYKVVENDTKTKFWSLTFNYNKLYQIKKWSNDKWNFKTGGALQITNNFRINELLENNAYGYEGFLNILFSNKVTRDITRTRAINKSFWIFHYNRKPRKREISYQLNLGVCNNYVRNGYIYLGQSDVVNNFHLLDNYQAGIFKGYRVNSALNYTLYLKNNNAFQVSYLWDALSTAGKYDRFDMASHRIQFSLLFNLK